MARTDGPSFDDAPLLGPLIGHVRQTFTKIGITFYSCQRVGEWGSRSTVTDYGLRQFFLDEFFFGVSDPIDDCARRTVVCPTDHRCHRLLHL
ncbi:hypothetical protein EJD97_004323 [Solanum chilense]|uniref:Uncharacterized protein n=1 Tax=Solanum chilense TaxID=4083 RepID=A0A6N2CFQ7_SOLCI|nr:hypothetical protein EJD97_004323 [Solanum chilense]